MYLLQSAAQNRVDQLFDASGTITSGGTAQLMLPQSKSRAHLLIVNNSSAVLYIQIGVLPGKATISGGVVTGITVPDVGFGFQAPPDIFIYGGGNSNNLGSFGATMPDWPPPSSAAQAIAVMGSSPISGQNISSITVTSGGSGYLAAPYVNIVAKSYDPTGVGVPSATAGIQIPANGGQIVYNGTTCPTSAISVYGATTGQAYICKWML